MFREHGSRKLKDLIGNLMHLRRWVVACSQRCTCLGAISISSAKRWAMSAININMARGSIRTLLWWWEKISKENRPKHDGQLLWNPLSRIPKRGVEKRLFFRIIFDWRALQWHWGLSARRAREDLSGCEKIGGTEVIEGPCDGFLIVRNSSREGRRDRVRMAEVCKGRTWKEGFDT